MGKAKWGRAEPMPARVASCFLVPIAERLQGRLDGFSIQAGAISLSVALAAQMMSWFPNAGFRGMFFSHSRQKTIDLLGLIR